ncbi:hypothetical protein AZI86_00595 [Bdellovibrio bacteriovorus]|uniref:HTH cro/C1-type domain-containing protein n=1 Tax=Bdellovibrio bacteriovorus TaxID=959 RepID=A0A150WMC5_BDEBC|nr:helix-turn-helix transcriptional regulator [Bdellovibrio bacteriovorus]KYG65612.1 hypothetical protein AZI86_00595 [Bdellovibrio bacteriovorus]
MTTAKRNVDALEFFEKLSGPMTLGRAIAALRLSDEKTQVQYAKKLGISQNHLSQIEKGLKVVSVERAKKFAKALGHSEIVFVQLAVQDELDRLGIKMKVHLKIA